MNVVKGAVLSQNSEAVVRLREKLSSGELSGTETPKQAWLSDVLFQQHKLDNFRTCYNKMKEQYKSEAHSKFNFLSLIFNLSDFILFYNLSKYLTLYISPEKKPTYYA